MSNPGFATHKIKKATFDRVDLVPEGANSAADIVLFKAKKDEGGPKMPKTYEEIVKSLPEEEQAVVTAELQKEKDTSVDLQKQLDKKDEEAIEKAKEEEMTEDELILKSLTGPAKEAFLKMKKERDDEKLEKEKLEKETFEASLSKELEEIDFAKTIDGFEDNYKKLAKESPELKTMVLDLLKQMDQVVEVSDLFKELGSSSEEEMDDSEQLESLTKERAKADGISYEQAYAVVLKENPDLYEG